MDILESLVKGKRCGLLTAGSGTDSLGVPTYIKLHQKGLLTVLFSPEHGVHSVMQDGAWSGSYIDAETGIPVYDLPSKGNPRIDEALSFCDVVIYDIQDVGARFYTYIYCLASMMKECAKRRIPVVVLDRPNPITGELSKMSGAILDEENFISSVGMYAMPVRYCMTCGEFAKYVNEKKSIGCELHVINCEGWRRGIYADETTMPWINPSPNIPTVNCAVNYIGTCLIEATNISEGRGTTRPFDIVGAPFIDSADLCRKLNSAKLEGVFFSRAFFTPMFGKCQGEVCEGIQLNITDRKSYDPHAAGLHLLAALKDYKEMTIREQGLCLRYGRDTLTKDPTFDPNDVLCGEKQGIEEFKNEIKDYLIYD
ncbi:MAG: DUF1343 domain-containing protein [Eubacteriales bacterium]